MFYSSKGKYGQVSVSFFARGDIYFAKWISFESEFLDGKEPALHPLSWGLEGSPQWISYVAERRVGLSKGPYFIQLLYKSCIHHGGQERKGAGIEKEAGQSRTWTFSIYLSTTS